MLSLTEYARADAHELMRWVRRGEVSTQELSRCALRAIDALDPQLNFMVSRSVGADALPAPGTERAAFHGLPFLAKSNGGTRGQPMAMASRLAHGLVSPHDSEFVRRLRATGIALLGSTNVPEFGSSPTTESVLHGPARNPWNLAHSCGGSSGGSSAAVAAGVVPVAQSTDGGGSIRTPAHCCGVFGLKPSRGRNPSGPGGQGGPFGIGCAHVATRSVRDSAAFLDATAGDEPGALYRCVPPERPFADEVGRSPGRLRVALWTGSPSGVGMDPACTEAVIHAARHLAALGHAVEEASPPLPWEDFVQAMLDLWSLGFPLAVAELAQLSGRSPGLDTLESSSLRLWQHGLELTPERIERSTRTMHRIVCELDRFLQRFDVVLSAVDIRPAPRLGEIDANGPWVNARAWFDAAVTQFCPHTPLYNFGGQPAMAVPWSRSPAGLPVGVQFAAQWGGEAVLLRLAAQLEATHPWADNLAPLHAARLEN
ncbi:MAG: amidase [Burkholderiaceae bacterium]